MRADDQHRRRPTIDAVGGRSLTLSLFLEEVLPSAVQLCSPAAREAYEFGWFRASLASDVCKCSWGRCEAVGRTRRRGTWGILEIIMWHARAPHDLLLQYISHHTSRTLTCLNLCM